jgi:Ca-activated chloride channel family protein
VIRWAAPQVLILLLSVPVMAVLMLAGGWLKRRSLRRLADPGLIPRLTDSRSPRLAAIKALCLLLGLTFLIVAAARPQWGEKLQVYKGRGIDIVIALDASKSMLATDVAPNRLSRSKTQIAALLDNLSTNRVGIVAFAGNAQIMCPLTPDVEAAKLFLDIIDPDNMPRPGTNIQHAVESAASLFDPGAGSSKALVLITDGDNLDGDPAAATKLAADEGIRIFAVGVGTPEGSTIPESHGSGTSYKKDKDDRIVVTRLAERLLLVMAKATDGRYFRSESINLNNLVGALDQLEKKAFGGGEYMEYEERYQHFLLVAFLLIVAGLFISDRRSAWFKNMDLSMLRSLAPVSRPDSPKTGAGSAALVLAALIGLAAPVRADVGSSMRRGLALERAGKYDEAVKAFQEALVLEPDNVRIHYNIGRALHQMKQQPEALGHFQLGLLSKSRPLRAKSLYNMGNCQFRQNHLDEAIASYTQVLLQQPGDLQAKQNLEYCWKMKQQQQQKPDSTQQKPQNEQQQQQQQQKQQSRQAQARKGAISRDQADRMLQALQGKEKENLKNQPKRPSAKDAGGKDW